MPRLVQVVAVVAALATAVAVSACSGSSGHLKGAEFDALWLQSMIGHHRGAVEMAQAEIDNGVNTGAVAMADNIVTTQQAEIDRMTKMLEDR